MIRGIIPAAGYGTRISMEKNQSKELLIDPATNEPLIEFHFKQCIKYKIKPLVLLRKEKRDLIKYCKRKKIEYLIIPNHDGEWYDTILMSKHKWYQWNIIMLPDTKYIDNKYDDILFQQEDLQFNVLTLCHIVDEPIKWGMCKVEDGHGFGVMCEKPNFTNYYFDFAWGILAFKKEWGEYLMNNFKKKQPFVIPNFMTYEINNFEDLTRDQSLNLSFKKK